MPVAHLPSAAGLAEADGQIGADQVLQRLVGAEVLSLIEVPAHGPCIALAGAENLDELILRMKSRLIAEGILLGAVKQWARNLALGSYDSFNLRGGMTPPTVSRFQWDITAPSYISGLRVWDAKAGKPRPGFLVADVLLGRSSVGERDLRPFLYKCHSLRQVHTGRFLQFFLAEGFSHQALTELRRYGIVPARIDELFGKETAIALKELVSTLSQTAATAVDAAKFDRLFSSLGRFEGASGRLRGALFEFVAGAILNEEGWHDVILNKVYREGGKDLAEVDVRARRGDDLLFVECKGIAPGTVLDDAEVEKWLNKRVPAVASRARQNEEHANCKLKFELWVTGELSEPARSMISERQSTIRPEKYSVAILFGPDIERIARRHKRRQHALHAVLEEHFLKNPLGDAS